jgi:hypothetical protein
MNFSSPSSPTSAALFGLLMIASAPAIAAEPGTAHAPEQATPGNAAGQPATSDTPEQQQSEESYDDSSHDGCPFNTQEHEKPVTG